MPDFNILKNAETIATKLLVLLALTVLASLPGALRPAVAASSPWVAAADSKLRLVSGGPIEDGKGVWAGVQVRLAPGWKTYWRSPGDSGVPPYFDWSGSKNLKSADLLYPAPKNMPDAGGQAYGYKGEVVFPVRIVPEQADQPVTLKLSMDFGLCKDICIPAHADLALSIPAGKTQSSADSLIIDGALAWVPKPVEKTALPALMRLDEKFDALKPQLIVDVAFAKDAERTDLFIDSGEYYIPPAMADGDPKETGQGKTQRFVVTFRDKEEAEELTGQVLTFTMVSDRGAREVERKIE